MTTSVLALALAASVALGCGRGPSETVVLALPPDTEARTYTLVDSLSDLPSPVVEAALALCARCEIADVGERFRETDVVITRSLPTRRLIRAGYSGVRWFIHYEHGGRGYHEHVAMFDLDGGPATFAGGSVFNTESGAISHIYSTCSPGQSDCEW